MAKSKELHEKDIIDVIKKHKVTNISHIFVFYTDCNRATFYNLDLDKLDSIKEAIKTNRAKACSFMLSKWIASDRDALQISAFKILCSDEERKALSMAFTDNKHTIEKPILPEWMKEGDD